MNTPNKGAIVIGMPLRNGAKTIRRAVESVVNQRGVKREVLLLIVNDSSTDNWRDAISGYLDYPNILVERVNFGKTYSVRNYILDYVKDKLPQVDYIGRIDSDDFLYEEYALSRIEKIMDLYDPDVIIAGNKQMLNGKIVHTNYADKRLLDMNYLKNRLSLMVDGILEGELPSCNVFVKSTVEVRYKDVESAESAEDHLYTVDLLLNNNRYNIYLAEDVIYAVYSLEGNVTYNNKKQHVYISSRKKLYEYFLKKIGDDDYKR